MMRRKLSRRCALQYIAAALLISPHLGVLASNTVRAEEEESWRFYRNANPAFTMLYPTTLATKRVGKRVADDTTLVQEWLLPAGAGDIHLTVTDGAAGGTMSEWAQSHVGSGALPVDIAGLRGATVESLADGVYAIAIYVDEPSSHKILGFTLQMRNVAPGTTLAAAKSAYRKQATEFWRMVESLKVGE
jgi:hypothetical protein